MLKRFVYAVLLLFALVTPTPQPVAAASPPASPMQRMECTVYVTRTGERYHKAGCGYLRYSQAPMSRSEAIRRGYTPCKRCGGSNCER
jgi:hypothetical protein